MLKIECYDAISFLKTIDDESIDMVCSSSPYWNQRDYETTGIHWDAMTYKPIDSIYEIIIPEWQGELGSEPTIELFIGHMVMIYREIKRVLKKTGVVWMNIGDSFLTNAKGKGVNAYAKSENNNYKKKLNGLLEKNLIMVPARLALALQMDGWTIRNDAIWAKANGLPESVQDRFTRNHEYFFHLVKSQRYYFDMQAVAEPVAESTPARMQRGVSSVHKMVNGAPGQSPHSMNQPRENENLSGGDFSSKYASAQPDHGGESHRRPYPTRSKRSVMTLPTSPSAYDFCRCGRLYLGSERKLIREERLNPETNKMQVYMKPCLNCGKDDDYISHYAAYSRALIEPLIKSSCPEIVCKNCGTPYQRIVRKVGSNWEERKANGAPMRYGMNNNKGQGSTNYGGSQYINESEEDETLYMDYGDSIRKRASTPGSEITSKTSVFRTGKVAIKESSGWQKMCECDTDETRPGTCLDPFLGSGTTAMTAISLNRDFIGADINPDYVALTNARIARWREDPQFKSQHSTLSIPDENQSINEVPLGSSKPVQINLFGDNNG